MPADDARDTACNRSIPPGCDDYEVRLRKRGQYFTQLGMIVTERCNIRCAHCIFSCNRASTRLAQRPFFDSVIAAAAATRRITLIGFTGGEAFLEFERLVRLVAACREHGLKAVVTTNGFWARSLPVALRRLAALPGLTHLAVSTDQFHQEFIPVARVRTVIEACAEVGIPCSVRLSYLNDPQAEIDMVKRQLHAVDGLYQMETQPITPAGRAAVHVDQDRIFSYDVTTTPCESADHPVVTASGDVFACCGPAAIWPEDHPLRLGNVHRQSMDEIIRRADAAPVVHVLRLWGPAELLRLVDRQAEAEGLSLSLPDVHQFVEMCGVCRFVLTDPEFTALLDRALSNAETYHSVAAARAIDLAETSMLL